MGVCTPVLAVACSVKQNIKRRIETSDAVAMETYL